MCMLTVFNLLAERGTCMCMQTMSVVPSGKHVHADGV